MAGFRVFYTGLANIHKMAEDEELHSTGVLRFYFRYLRRLQHSRGDNQKSLERFSWFQKELLGFIFEIKGTNIPMLLLYFFKLESHRREDYFLMPFLTESTKKSLVTHFLCRSQM